MTKQDIFRECLLSAKTALDSINVPFWLACGTALGIYRENRFIHHDPDIDIETLITNYDPRIQHVMSKNGFIFELQLGTIANGLEMKFKYRGKNSKTVKLDLFFMYKRKDYYWRSSYWGINWEHVRLGKEIPCQLATKFKDIKINKIELWDKIFNLPDIRYIEQIYKITWRIPIKKFKHYNVGPAINVDRMPFRIVEHKWLNDINFIMEDRIGINHLLFYYPNANINSDEYKKYKMIIASNVYITAQTDLKRFYDLGERDYRIVKTKDEKIILQQENERNKEIILPNIIYKTVNPYKIICNLSMETINTRQFNYKYNEIDVMKMIMDYKRKSDKYQKLRNNVVKREKRLEWQNRYR